MTDLSALWLPILLGAVLVFIASSIIHMAPLWHQGDFAQVPNEGVITRSDAYGRDLSGAPATPFPLGLLLWWHGDR